MKRNMRAISAAVLGGLLVLGGILWADTTTNRIGLTKPDVGSTNWGPKLNTNFDLIDSSAAVLSSTNNFTAAQTISGGLTISSGTTVSSTLTVTGAAVFSSSVTMTGSLQQANVPMNSKKFTGLAAGSTTGDSTRWEQLKILQIQYAGTATATSTTNTTYIDMNLSRTITPLSASSTIYAYISLVGNGSTTGAQSGAICKVRLLRDGSELNAWDRTLGYSAAANIQDSRYATFATLYPNQPGGTSEYTYKVQFAEALGAGTCSMVNDLSVLVLFEAQ